MCPIEVKAVLFAYLFSFHSMITESFQTQETYCKKSELALFTVSSQKAGEEPGKQNLMNLQFIYLTDIVTIRFAGFPATRISYYLAPPLHSNKLNHVGYIISTKFAPPTCIM